MWPFLGTSARTLKRLRDAEEGIATLEGQVADMRRRYDELEDYVERGLARLYKRAQRKDPPEDTEQQQLAPLTGNGHVPSVAEMQQRLGRRL